MKVSPALLAFQFDELFYAAANASSDVIIVADEKRQIVFANRIACERTGFKAKELIGRKIPILYPKELEAKITAQVYSDLKKSGQWIGEIAVQKKDGTTFSTDTRIIALHNQRGQFVGSLGIGRDLTFERRYDQRTWEGPTNLLPVIESMADAIAVCDPEGKILMCNKAHCSMIGYNREEIIGARPPYPWMGLPEAVSFREGFRKLSKEKTLRNYPITWRRRDHSSLIVSLACTPLDGGQLSGKAYVIAARDITDVNLTDDLRRMRDQVQRLHSDVSKKAARLQTLQEINAFVLNTMDLDKIFRAITAGIKKLVSHDLAGIYLYEPGSDAFLPRTLSKQTPFSRRLARFPLPLGEGIIGAAAVIGQMVWVNNAQLDPRSKYPEGMRPGLEHFIAVPLKGRTAIFGVLVVARHRDPEFIEEEAFIVKSFAEAASVALENTRLHTELYRFSGNGSKGKGVKPTARGVKRSTRARVIPEMHHFQIGVPRVIPPKS